MRSAVEGGVKCDARAQAHILPPHGNPPRASTSTAFDKRSLAFVTRSGPTRSKAGQHMHEIGRKEVHECIEMHDRSRWHETTSQSKKKFDGQTETGHQKLTQ